MTAEGIYYFTVRANSSGALYEDTIGVAVLAREQFDNLLRSKWEGMKAKLASQDIAGSLAFFSERRRDAFGKIFTAVAPKLPVILQEMGDIQLIEVYRDAAIYDLRTVRRGVEYSFQLMFLRDEGGIWRIDSF